MEEQGSGDQFSGLNTFAEQQVETEKGAFMYVQRECSPTWLRGFPVRPCPRNSAFDWFFWSPRLIADPVTKKVKPRKEKEVKQEQLAAAR